MTDFPAPSKTERSEPKIKSVGSGPQAKWSVLGLAWEFGFVIIVPLLVFGLGGLYLDRLVGTRPWLFLGGMVLAVVLTTFFLVRRFSRIIREYNDSSTPPKE